MLTTVAAFMIIVWPGHDVSVQHYQSRAVCEQALDQLHHAGHDLFESVPGFKAWCEPDGPELTS